MDFSIFKVEDTMEHISHVLEKDYEMDKIGERTLRNIVKKYQSITIDADIIAEFYYKTETNHNVPVKWANYWAPFFGESEIFSKEIESSYGVILISVNNKCYGVSMGRAHHYINKLCNIDFAMDVAEIIIKEDKIHIKSAKFFKKSKNKALTQYNYSSFVTPEIGESDELVVGEISLDAKYQGFLLQAYKDNMKFGTSIKMNISDFKPLQLLESIVELDYIYENEYDNRKTHFPRLQLIKDNSDNDFRLSDFDSELLSDILNQDDSITTLSYFLEDSGDIIINPFDNNNISLIYEGKSYDIQFSLLEIKKTLAAIKCSDINKVSLKNKETKISKKLKLFLDYNTVKAELNYCLYRGKWARFNDSYLEHIEQEIQEVNKVVKIKPEWDLTNELLSKGKCYMKSDNKYDNVDYSEYPYNIYLHELYGYKLLDRERQHQIFNEIEFADLYGVNDKSLIHVKIGGTKDLRYCIQQSSISAELFNRHRGALEIYGISESRKIAMLFILKTNNLFIDDDTIDFSKSKSIYLKVELIEWLQRIRSLNFEPIIYISKDLRTKDDARKQLIA